MTKHQDQKGQQGLQEDRSDRESGQPLQLDDEKMDKQQGGQHGQGDKQQHQPGQGGQKQQGGQQHQGGNR
jgi:hypothetical protein